MGLIRVIIIVAMSTAMFGALEALAQATKFADIDADGDRLLTPAGSARRNARAPDVSGQRTSGKLIAPPRLLKQEKCLLR